ncbi:carbohydrate ABC transporter permease [Petrotoga sp. 9PWA.NaAc.5.4]|uniref:carbohydrate ABC transporter permease n=1 Tax=Petrotoga sp. 9PWA.NaAc.5.4 TaxID=1434328 RepID=UPI000CAEB84B|nr:carbohydrate ABC transporter permease [Petrotoga sp. 9PWA.NaAc.5.4]PNR94176.1 hypothetical protein X924_07070 [Petrotoga sp. 9PWA.NaAc.5.4]
MNYKNFWKTMQILIIYLLLVAGTIAMLLPFAWMIITSLKTTSEINQWPPTWTTKNFKNHWNLNLEVSSSTFSTQRGLSLAEFRTISTEQDYIPNKLVYTINGDLVKRGDIKISFENINYSDSSDIDGLMTDIFEYVDNIALKDDLQNLLINRDINLKNFEKIYIDLFSENSGYYKQTNMIRRVQQTIINVQNFIDLTLERNINLLPYFRTNENMDPSQIEKIQESKKIFSNYLQSIKEESVKLNEILRSYKLELRLINSQEAEEIINLLADFLSNIETFDDEILSNTNTLIQRNIYNPILQDINTLTFYIFFKEKYNVIQNTALNDVFISFKIPDKHIKYQNLMQDLESSNFSSSFINTVKDLASPNNIDALNHEIISYFERDILDDIENLLVKDPRELSTYYNIIRTLASRNVPLEEASKVLSSNDYQFLINNITGKEDNFSTILEKKKEYDRIINEFNKFYLDSIARAILIESPDFIDKILFKNNSKIEIFTKNIPAIWLIDEKPQGEVNFTFGEVLLNTFQNYSDAWNAAPFSRYYINTIIVAIVTTICEIIFAAMAAFAFAKLNFWGKNLIFTIFLGTMMIPGEVLLVPNYITISKFSWIDSYYALIVPWVVSVFAIFLIRQQFMTIPNDLWDAAKIDGSSSWRFLWTVMVPLSKSAILTGALLKFVGSWNAFLWVLIVTKSPEMRTLAVGLQNFRTDAGEIYNLLMAASTFTMIPIVILFIFLQRYFVEGISRSGLKG